MKVKSRGILLLVVAVMAMLVSACVNDWRPNGGWSSTAEAEEWVYVGSVDGHLVRFNKISGQADTQWAYPSREVEGLGAIYNTPLVENGLVYGAAYTCTGTECSGMVFAIAENCSSNTTACTRLATVSFDNARFVGAPALYGETLLVGTDHLIAGPDAVPGYLNALNMTVAENVGLINRITWRLPVDGAIWSGVTLIGDTAYFGTREGTLYAVDVSESPDYVRNPEARIKWSFKMDTVFASTPIINDGRLYANAFNKVFALNLEDRAAAGIGATEVTLTNNEWMFATNAGAWSNPTLDEDTLYIGTLNGSIYALNAATGTMVWEQPTNIPGSIVGNLTVVSVSPPGFLIVPSFERDVHIVNLPNGEYEKRVYRTSAGVAASPTLINETLFVHDLQGMVYGFDPITRNEKSCARIAEGEPCR